MTTRSQSTGTILDEIVAWTREEVERRKRWRSLGDLVALARAQPGPRDFAGALAAPRPGPAALPRLIAEVKRASPSKGLLCPDFDPARLARAYAAGGASAISVLTEPRFFLGDPAYVGVVHEATALPALRKDFLFDPYQVVEARAIGADAVLLIVAILPGELLGELLALARSLGMAALVEVHSADEVERALGAGAEIVGVNNRDLRTFAVDLETTRRLRGLVPAGRLVVSESGIRTRADLETLREWRVDAALVGEALVKSGDPAARLAELLT